MRVFRLNLLPRAHSAALKLLSESDGLSVRPVRGVAATARDRRSGSATAAWSDVLAQLSIPGPVWERQVSARLRLVRTASLAPEGPQDGVSIPRRVLGDG